MSAVLPSRWIDRWNAFWFPTTTTLPLAVCRIVAVAAQLFWFFPRLDRHLNLIEKNAAFIEPQLFIMLLTAVVPRNVLFTTSAFTALWWITAAAGVAALVGLFTRTSMFILALGIWIFVAHMYSYSDVHHEAALFAILLVCLAFSPIGERLSIDALIRRRRGRGLPPDATSDTAMWALRLAHVLLAMTYLSTGMTKIIDGGPAWVNGYTLQAYLFRDALPREFPLGVWLAHQHGLCVALSIYTVLYETFFFVSLLVPWTAPLFFINGIVFHAMLYLTAGHDFFPHIVTLTMLLIVTAPGWWRNRRQMLREATPSRWRRPAVAAHAPV
jgi:hypothetical protein